MTINATTPSRYLLAIARVILTHEQFTNGYLPDFRGDRTGRVPIPEQAVMKLKGLSIYFFSLIFIVLFAEAVRKRFGFKTTDMDNIWKNIRSSMVQKVTDVRKRQSEKTQTEQQPIRSAEEQIDIAANITVDQTEVMHTGVVVNQCRDYSKIILQYLWEHELYFDKILFPFIVFFYFF